MKKNAAQRGIWVVSTLWIFGSARPSRLVPACGAIALFATALFFLLHHLGNQLPYDLAMQRFQAEFESDQPDEGHAKRYKGMYEYCELSGIVMAGARRMKLVVAHHQVPPREENALRNAVILKRLTPTPGTSHLDALSRRAYCNLLEAAANGTALPRGVLKPRYWFGGKALYAIALRWYSVYQIREFTRIATYVAYLLLAVSLLLLSPKMLLLAAPLVAFGAFFSGIEYWADIANGLPYLWTVLLAAGLALLVWRRRGRTWHETVPVCCFAAGSVSAYLGLLDGHTYLAVAWIGMVVWFGSGCIERGANSSPLHSEQPPLGAPFMLERTKRTVSCIALYGAGLVVCYTLGQAAKAMFLGAEVWWSFWNGLVGIGEAVDGWGALAAWPAPSTEVHVSRYLDFFYVMAWPDWLPSGVVPTAAAASSLTIALGLAVFEARRGRSGLLWGVLWIVCLVAVVSMRFLYADREPYRTARFVFVPLALCLSSLVLCAWTVHWRMSLATASRLSAVLLGIVIVVAGAVSWYLPVESRMTAKLIESVAHLRPVASSAFDVYLDVDQLVYAKEECDDEDVDARFLLHVFPVDVADLPNHRQPHGYDNLDFSFRRLRYEMPWRHGTFRGDGRCAAVRTLPDYDAVAIRTGQYMLGEDPEWSERIDLPGAVDRVIESVEDMQPAASSAFDVYLHEGRLVYVKEECFREDVYARFFLHLYPADVADLPRHRRPIGFDNLDFSFARFGLRDGRRCVAQRPLPDYQVVVIWTGQYIPGRGAEWSVRIDLDSLE